LTRVEPWCWAASVTSSPAGVRDLVARHRRGIGLAAAAVATALAVLWLWVVPDPGDASGAQAWVIRYGHALCWALLAVAAAAYATGRPSRARGRVVAVAAWAALAWYVAFLAATLW
jgi:hypothetical protein